jgi:hypothetical protein
MLNEHELKKRRVELLWSLYQRGDGVLQMAARVIGREAGGPVFEFDKRQLIKDGAIEEADIRAGHHPSTELYKVTAEGEDILREWGYL